MADASKNRQFREENDSERHVSFEKKYRWYLCPCLRTFCQNMKRTSRRVSVKLSERGARLSRSRDSLKENLDKVKVKFVRRASSLRRRSQPPSTVQPHRSNSLEHQTGVSHKQNQTSSTLLKEPVFIPGYPQSAQQNQTNRHFMDDFPSAVEYSQGPQPTRQGQTGRSLSNEPASTSGFWKSKKQYQKDRNSANEANLTLGYPQYPERCRQDKMGCNSCNESNLTPGYPQANRDGQMGLMYSNESSQYPRPARQKKTERIFINKSSMPSEDQPSSQSDNENQSARTSFMLPTEDSRPRQSQRGTIIDLRSRNVPSTQIIAPGYVSRLSETPEDGSSSVTRGQARYFIKRKAPPVKEDEEELPEASRRKSLYYFDGFHSSVTWADLVKKSKDPKLRSLSEKDKYLQQAMLDIITTQRKYFESLRIFYREVYHSDLLMLEGQEKETSDECGSKIVLKVSYWADLFSNLDHIYSLSKTLLFQLQQRWEHEQPVLSGICDILFDHYSYGKEDYIRYMRGYPVQEETYSKIILEVPDAVEILHELESSPACQFIPILIQMQLPIQRLLQMPLLVAKILRLQRPHTDELKSCNSVLLLLHEIIYEGKKGNSDLLWSFQMETLNEMLIFTKVMGFEVYQKGRLFVKKSKVILVCFDKNKDDVITDKFVKIYLFLFSDVVIIAKKRKYEELYDVCDHCNRSYVEFIHVEDHLTIDGITVSLPDTYKKSILLIFLKNWKSETSEWLIIFNDEPLMSDWAALFAHAPCTVGSETVWPEWNSPLYATKQPHHATKDDELTLKLGNIIKVYKKSESGLMLGENIETKEKGWFSAMLVQEMESDYSRGNSLRNIYHTEHEHGYYILSSLEIIKKFTAKKQKLSWKSDKGLLKDDDDMVWGEEEFKVLVTGEDMVRK